MMNKSTFTIKGSLILKNIEKLILAFSNSLIKVTDASVENVEIDVFIKASSCNVIFENTTFTNVT